MVKWMVLVLSTDCRSIALRKNETQGDDGLAKSGQGESGQESRCENCARAQGG